MKYLAFYLPQQYFLLCYNTPLSHLVYPANSNSKESNTPQESSNLCQWPYLSHYITSDYLFLVLLTKDLVFSPACKGHRGQELGFLTESMVPNIFSQQITRHFREEHKQR